MRGHATDKMLPTTPCVRMAVRELCLTADASTLIDVQCLATFQCKSNNTKLSWALFKLEVPYTPHHNIRVYPIMEFTGGECSFIGCWALFARVVRPQLIADGSSL